MQPILAEHEMEPSAIEIERAEYAAAISIEKMRNAAVLADNNPRSEVWLTPAVEPPLNTDIELKIRAWGKEHTVQGWASRRFCKGALTFWIRHLGRVRYVTPIGWRAVA